MADVCPRTIAILKHLPSDFDQTSARNYAFSSDDSQDVAACDRRDRTCQERWSIRL